VLGNLLHNLFSLLSYRCTCLCGCAHVVCLVLSLQGRGSEAVLLPGDGASKAGTIDDPGSNRKTVLELLSLDPHENNVLPSYRLSYLCLLLHGGGV
jgi:hypothetical protein